MKRILPLFLFLSMFAHAQTAYHRVSQVIARAPQGGATAQVVPYATIAVTNSFTGLAQTIYYDYALSTSNPTSTVKSDASGNYGYYLALNQCANETISYPGMVSPIVLSYVCSFGQGALSGISTPSGGGLISSTAGGIATIQANPAYIPFLTATGAQAFAGPLVMTGLTVTGDAAGSGTNCLKIDTSGVITNTGAPCSPVVYPGAGIPKSTGTAWGTSYTAQGTDTALLTAGTVSGTAAALCTDANGGATTVGCPGGVPYPGAGIPLSTGSAWSTSYAAQGTDSKLLTSGTVSGTGATLCTDANGGATTSGCAASPTFQTNGVNNSLQTTLNLIAGSNVSLVNSGGGVTISAASGFLITRTCNSNGCYQQTSDGTYTEWIAATPTLSNSGVLVTLPHSIPTAIMSINCNDNSGRVQSGNTQAVGANTVGLSAPFSTFNAGSQATITAYCTVTGY